MLDPMEFFSSYHIALSYCCRRTILTMLREDGFETNHRRTTTPLHISMTAQPIKIGGPSDNSGFHRNLQVR